MNCRRILKTFGISNHICTYGLQKLVSTSDSIHPIPRSRISEWRRAKLWLDMNLLRAKWFITQQDYKILISSLSSNIKLLAKNVGHSLFSQTWNFLKTLKNDLKHCIISINKKASSTGTSQQPHWSYFTQRWGLDFFRFTVPSLLQVGTSYTWSGVGKQLW